MRTIARLALLLSFLLAPTLEVRATLLGGDITWTCLGNGQYQFRLDIYADCADHRMWNIPVSINSPFGPLACYWDSSASQFPVNTCRNYNPAAACQWPSPAEGVYRMVYKSDSVSLNGIPPVTGWEFSWSECCMSTAENGSGLNILIRSVMYPVHPPGSSMPYNSSTCFDNSPRISQFAAGILPDGRAHTLSQQPLDSDLDSVSIQWAPVALSTSQNFSYNPGFSIQTPFPDSSENSVNGPNTLNAANGLMQFETYGAALGWYYYGLVVRSYRFGQLLAENFRTGAIRISDSSLWEANASAPQITIDTSVYRNIQQQGQTYFAEVYEGDSLSLNLSASDFDQYPDGSFQNLCMEVSGVMINESNPSDSTGCLGVAPCARLTSLNASGTYCSSLVNTARFSWKPDCNLIPDRQPQAYRFLFQVSDDACPSPKSSTVELIVKVKPHAYPKLPLSFQADSLGQKVGLTWSSPSLNPGDPFGYYAVYMARDSVGPYFLTDSIPHLDTVSTQIQLAFRPAYFYLQYFAGPCMVPSAKSEVVHLGGLVLADLARDAISVFPNPVNEQLNISLAEQGSMPTAVSLFDVRGRLLCITKLLNQEATLDFPYPPGVYLLALSKQDQVLHFRILKE